MPTPITARMKVDEALRLCPQGLSVFVAYGFKPLQNPLLRKTFAPMMTIQGAAKMHHWEPERLERFLAELNAAAAMPAAPEPEPDEAPPLLYDLGDVAGLRAQRILVSPEVVQIDNLGLEQPEPMVRILSIAQQLAPGQRLVATNARKPMLLYPKLEELGYRHETEALPGGTFRITIWREAVG
ncbi:MAG TPA: DUF2249 domain-containing protein [Oscillatoriaceae cyanobacterium]